MQRQPTSGPKLATPLPLLGNNTLQVLLCPEASLRAIVSLSNLDKHSKWVLVRVLPAQSCMRAEVLTKPGCITGALCTVHESVLLKVALHRAQHSAAQHSAAQHSTAQHSTAQHSTACLHCSLHANALLSVYTRCPCYEYLIIGAVSTVGGHH